MGQAMLSGFIVFGSIYAAYSYLSNQNIKAARQAARIAKVLEDLRTGTTNINFVLEAPPLVVSEQEKVAAVLPKTTLLEPKTVRVRQGSRNSSSTRIVRGYSVGSGSYNSTTESREQLRAIDLGTLVVTNQRIVFMGQLKTISIDVNKMMGIDEYRDSIGIHIKDKPNVESFRISDDLMLTYHEVDEDVPLPFTGQILGCIINHTIADHDARNGTAAA
jgi:archaellum component FlaF (FlaF/FlaG flagellin family)